MDSGVSLDGPILLLFGSPFGLGLALDLALAAKFLLFSAVFLATDFAAVFALPGALFAACFAAAAVFLVVCEALSSFLAAAATFFATAACSPALTNLAVPLPLLWILCLTLHWLTSLPLLPQLLELMSTLTP